MEELWSKGEAGEDFDSSPRIIEPDHFLCMFLIMGCIFSLKLIFLLLDILTNPSFGFLKLMLSGMFACFLITFNNLLYFYFALWTPITVDYGRGDIFRGDIEINLKMLANNKIVAFAILGYGAVTSFIFIFVAMIRSIGNTHSIFIKNIFYIGLLF